MLRDDDDDGIARPCGRFRKSFACRPRATRLPPACRPTSAGRTRAMIARAMYGSFFRFDAGVFVRTVAMGRQHRAGAGIGRRHLRLPAHATRARARFPLRRRRRRENNYVL